MDDLANLIFLILVPLFFLGFIAAFIFLIINKLKTGKSLVNWVQKNNYLYFKKLENQPELDDLRTYLEKTIYQFDRKTRRFIKDIVIGEYMNFKFLFAFYHSIAKQSSAKNRGSSSFNLLIIPDKNIHFDLMIIKQTKAMRFLAIDKWSKMFGFPLYSLKDDGIDWLLVSDVDQFKQLEFNNSRLAQLKDALENAHSIFFSQAFFVYAIQWPSLLAPLKIESFLKKVKLVKQLFS